MPPHASTPLFDVPTAPGMETVVIPAGAPIDETISAVAAAQPTHLVGYATVVGQLARATVAGRLDIRPVRVSTNSEPLLDEDRQAIRDAWDAPVHNLWGSTEIGVQAVGCARGEGLHVCEDEVVLERVDDSGAPVGPDEPAARTLATGLANRTFPFIRYDLGDQVNWLPGQCACGSAFARVADIGGRRDDDFRYDSATIPASVFRHVLGTDPRVSEYQVLQTARGADVLVVGDPDVDGLAAASAAALSRYGLRGRRGHRARCRETAAPRIDREAETLRPAPLVAGKTLAAHEKICQKTVVGDRSPGVVRRVPAAVDVRDARLGDQIVDQLLITGDGVDDQRVTKRPDPSARDHGDTHTHGNANSILIASQSGPATRCTAGLNAACPSPRSATIWSAPSTGVAAAALVAR